MSTARKYGVNQRSMSPESRRNAYAAININWLQMRPDLRFESKEIIREERLAWFASFLGLEKLDSTTDLSDGQIALLLDEMRTMNGEKTKLSLREKGQIEREHRKVVNIRGYRQSPASGNSSAEVLHLAGEVQIYTIKKLVVAIGWSDEGFEEFLFNKFRCHSPQMLTFKKANALTMILLNIAADKELRARGETKITRKMTAEYIPTLKRKLEIDR